MSETITLDPAAVAGSRTELDVTAYVAAPDGVDWGDGAIQAYVADQAVGSAPVDYRIPNRVVRIPLRLRDLGGTAFSLIRSALQHKAAIFQREGGWIMRTAGSVSLYADVVSATLHFGGSWQQAYGGADVDAWLELECVPEFYANEITGPTLTGTGDVIDTISFTYGNYPGRVRVAVSDTSGHDQRGLIWAFRSRYYDSAASAALSYEGEALSPLDAAGTVAHSGASGGSTMRHNSLPGGAWCPVLSTGNLTHKGSYRVWARVYSATATPSLRFAWDVGDLSGPTVNDPVQVPGAAAFYIVDLGSVRLDPAPVGTHRWAGVVQAFAAVQGDPIEIDKVWLQPLDESAGRLAAVQRDSALGVHVHATPGTAVDDSTMGTAVWTNPSLANSGNPGSCATATGAGISTGSHYLRTSTFGFAIPSGATISGIQVDVSRSYEGTTAVDTSVKLAKAGAVVGSDRADTVTPWVGLQTKTYGGAADLWGTTWSATDINNSGFGVALAGKASGSFGVDLFVYGVKITVYYTTSGGFVTTADAVIYASQTAELRTDGMYRTDSSGTAYGPVSSVTGDLPRIPPSGLEARTIQVFLKPSRGNITTDADSGLDSLSTVIYYRPSYLYVGGA